MPGFFRDGGGVKEEEANKALVSTRSGGIYTRTRATGFGLYLSPERIVDLAMSPVGSLSAQLLKQLWRDPPVISREGYNPVPEPWGLSPSPH